MRTARPTTRLWRASFRGRSFISRDGTMIPWLEALLAQLEAEPAEWLAALREDWRLQLSVAFDGLAEMELDGALDEAQRAHLVALAGAARRALAQVPLATVERWAVPYDRERARAAVLRTADAFLWILRWADDAGSPPERDTNPG